MGRIDKNQACTALDLFQIAGDVTVKRKDAAERDSTFTDSCLTNEEQRYLRHRDNMQLWGRVLTGIFLLLISLLFASLIWYDVEGATYVAGPLSIMSLLVFVLVAIGTTQKIFRRSHANHKCAVEKRKVRIFALSAVWFRPSKGCEVRSEKTKIPRHWSRFFDYLRPIDGDGSFDIDARICEAEHGNYVLSLSNGLSVGSEMSEGLLDTITMQPIREVTWLFFCWLSAVLAGLVLNEVLGIVPMTDSFAEFVSNPVIKYGLPVPLVLSVPAIYFWRQHKRALARIEAMYEAEGLPERGHERNVGASNGGNTSNARERHGPSS